MLLLLYILIIVLKIIALKIIVLKIIVLKIIVLKIGRNIIQSSMYQFVMDPTALKLMIAKFILK